MQPAKAGGLRRIVSAVAVHDVLLRERPDLLQVLYDEPCYYYWQVDAPADQLGYYRFRALATSRAG